VTQFIKKAFGGLINAVGSLGESAEDPRAFQTDKRAPHLESLKQVQNARYEVDLALEHLEVLATNANGSLISIDEQTEQGSHSERFGLELKREVDAEIAAIERQREHLRRQQEVLLMSERRLVAGIRRGAVSRQLEGATTVSSQAKQAADSALRKAGTDMRRLDAVINQARAATERLEDQSKVVDKIAGRKTDQPVAARQTDNGDSRTVAGFEDLRSGEYGPDLQRLAEKGSKITSRLSSEYQQLELAIDRHRAHPQAPGSRLAIGAARTFRQGMQHASDALEMLTQASFDKNVVDNATNNDGLRPVAEELAQAGRAESAIYRARLEFIALVKGDEDASAEAVFDALDNDESDED
jgi:hypothetical protein